MQARFAILLSSVALLIGGCNLFGQTPVPQDARDASQDVGLDVRVSDGMTPNDSATDDGVSTPDTSEPSDMRPPRVDGCTPPSDVELCNQYAADCDLLIVRAPDGVIERHQALDVGTNGTCGTDPDYLRACNGSAGPDLTFDAPVDGDYIVRTHAWATQAPSGTILSSLRLSHDGSAVREFAVAGTEEALGTYEALITLTAGTHDFSWRLANDYYEAGVEDRNLLFDWVEVEGPMVAPVDECGQTRDVQCGGCAGADACGFEQVGVCGCSCTNMDGTCAPEGPQAGNPCAVCVTGVGWTTAGASACDDGDACTIDTCESERAICLNRAMSCSGDSCEDGTCVNGTCEYVPKPEDTACGNGGVCASGLCQCPDGTNEEQQCRDNADEDCDGLTDCDDPDCDGRNCGPGMTCSAGACQ